MASIILFFLLLLLYLILGLNFYKSKSIKHFMLLTVVLPLTSALTIIHTRFQINVYYAFVIIPLLFYVFNTLVNFKTDKTIFLASGLILAFVTFYLCYTFLLNPDNLLIINIAKDVKPLLFRLKTPFVFGTGFCFS